MTMPADSVDRQAPQLTGQAAHCRIEMPARNNARGCMTETTPRTGGQEWRAHWTLVLAGVIGFSMTAMASISLGIFTEPLEHAFGWSRKEVI